MRAIVASPNLPGVRRPGLGLEAPPEGVKEVCLVRVCQINLFCLRLD